MSQPKPADRCCPPKEVIYGSVHPLSLTLYIQVPEEFFLCELQSGIAVYGSFLTYRCCSLLAILAESIVSTVLRMHHFGIGATLLMLSFWFSLGLVVQSIMALGLVVDRFLDDRRTVRRKPLRVHLMQVFWGLQTVSYNGVLCGLLFEVVTRTAPTSFIAALLVLIDMLLVAHPYSLGHFFFLPLVALALSPLKMLANTKRRPLAVLLVYLGCALTAHAILFTIFTLRRIVFGVYYKEQANMTSRAASSRAEDKANPQNDLPEASQTQ